MITTQNSTQVQTGHEDITRGRIILYVITSFGAMSGFFLFGSITPIKIAFVLLLVSSASHIVDNILSYSFDKLDVCLLLYLLSASISIAWAPDHSASINYLISYLTALILYFLVKVSVVKTLTQINGLLNAMFLVGVLACMISFLQVAAGVGFMPGTDARSIMTGGRYRANGFYFDPNYFSLVISALWPLAAYFIKIRWAKIIVVGMLVTTILLTLSRAALLVLVVQFLVLGLLYMHLTARSLVKILIVSLIVIAATITVMSQNLFGVTDRLITLLPIFNGEEFADNSTAERFDLLLAGSAMFKENWIKGVGFGGFEYYSPTYLLIDPRHVVAHNTFLTIAAEQGIIGITIWACIIYTLIRSIRNTDGFKLMFAAIIGLLGNMFFLVSHYMPFVYLFFAIISQYGRLSSIWLGQHETRKTSRRETL